MHGSHWLTYKVNGQDASAMRCGSSSGYTGDCISADMLHSVHQPSMPAAGYGLAAVPQGMGEPVE